MKTLFIVIIYVFAITANDEVDEMKVESSLSISIYSFIVSILLLVGFIIIVFRGMLLTLIKTLFLVLRIAIGLVLHIITPILNFDFIYMIGQIVCGYLRFFIPIYLFIVFCKYTIILLV